jgi:predicted transposase YdaD
MVQTIDIAKIARFNKEELMWYDIEKKRRSDAKAVMEFAIQEGLEKGMEKGVAIGREEGEAKILDLMAKGYNLEQIKEILKSK